MRPREIFRHRTVIGGLWLLDLQGGGGVGGGGSRSD